MNTYEVYVIETVGRWVVIHADDEKQAIEYAQCNEGETIKNTEETYDLQVEIVELVE